MLCFHIGKCLLLFFFNTVIHLKKSIDSQFFFNLNITFYEHFIELSMLQVKFPSIAFKIHKDGKQIVVVVGYETFNTVSSFSFLYYLFYLFSPFLWEMIQNDP